MLCCRYTGDCCYNCWRELLWEPAWSSTSTVSWKIPKKSWVSHVMVENHSALVMKRSKGPISKSHKCGRPYRPVANQRGTRTDRQRCYMFLNIKPETTIVVSDKTWYILLTHAHHTRTVKKHFDVSVTYPQGINRFKIVIIIFTLAAGIIKPPNCSMIYPSVGSVFRSSIHDSTTVLNPSISIHFPWR